MMPKTHNRRRYRSSRSCSSWLLLLTIVTLALHFRTKSSGHHHFVPDPYLINRTYPTILRVKLSNVQWGRALDASSNNRQEHELKDERATKMPTEHMEVASVSIGSTSTSTSMPTGEQIKESAAADSHETHEGGKTKKQYNKQLEITKEQARARRKAESTKRAEEAMRKSAQLHRKERHQAPTTPPEKTLKTMEVKQSAKDHQAERKENAQVDKQPRPIVVNPNPSIAFITFAHLTDSSRFDNFIFPSLDTWMEKETSPYFVVLNLKWQSNFRKLCEANGNQRYCDRLHPIWVDCEEDYYGASPCCKSDQGLSKMYKEFPDFDWYVYMDDDLYIRVDYSRSLLATLDPLDPALLSPSNLYPMGVSFFPEAYNCSWYKKDMYPWGNPVLYNQGAMRTMLRGLEMGAISKQCTSFDVTHDAGNAIVHWMYSFPVMRIGISHESPHSFTDRQTQYRSPDVGVGMHKVNVDFSFEETHRQYSEMSTSSFQYQWHNVTGFRKTRTYEKYGEPASWQDEWHTMEVDECAVGPTESEARGRNEKASEAAVASYKDRDRDRDRPAIAFITMQLFFPIDYSLDGLEQSLDSWLLDGVYFVIMDAYQSDMFHDEYCTEKGGRCDRIVPVWVDCPPQDYLGSCMAQEGLKKVFEQHPQFDWFVLLHSDTYLRLEFLRSHLEGIDSTQAVVVTSDNIRIVGVNTERTGDIGVCSHDGDENQYPLGRFVMYSQGAMDKILPGLQMGGLREQAAAMEVRKSGEGKWASIQTFNWMYSLPALVLPFAQYNPKRVVTKSKRSWVESQIVGIFVSLVKPMKEHEAYFESVTSIKPTLEWHNATGFHLTATYQEYGDPSTWHDGWHSMNIKECQRSTIAFKRAK